MDVDKIVVKYNIPDKNLFVLKQTYPNAEIIFSLDIFEDKSGTIMYLELGRKTREEYKLDTLDTDDKKYIIPINKNIKSINISFMLGLIVPSMKTLGYKKFKQKYVFNIETQDKIIRKGLEADLEEAHIWALEEAMNAK